MLTEEQQGTISVPSENKLICALPGSGKTHTFISLVDVISNESSSHTVMMTTFTNAGAAEMQERVVKRLGEQLAKRVTVGTFASLMRKQFLPLAGKRKMLMGGGQFTYIKRAMSQCGMRDMTVNEMQAIIDSYSADLSWKFDGTPSAKVYQAYLEILNRYGLYDIGMMSRELIFALRDGRIQPVSQSHILCDEFQDTDPQQYEWLQLNGVGKCVAVVGDDDQAIYSWRGSLGYNAFVDFQNDFEAASCYLLSKCFRCSPRILKAAQSLIENNTDRIDKDMESVKSEQGEVRYIEIPKSFTSERTRKLLESDNLTPDSADVKLDKRLERYRYVAQELEKSNAGGWAILARTNLQLDSIEQVLTEANIETVRMGGKSIFDNEHALGMANLFYGIAHPKAPFELSAGLGWAGEQEETLSQIYQASKGMGFASSSQFTGDVWSKITIEAQELAIQCQDASSQLSINNCIKAFVLCIRKNIERKSEFDERFQLKLLQIIESVISKAKGSLIDKAKALLETTRKSKKKETQVPAGSVVLATMNAAKGLEWPRVWIIEAEEKKIPMLKDDDGFEKLEEERRLMYVAATRAEEELVISFGEGQQSRFVVEMRGY